MQVQLHCLCLLALYLTTGYGQERKFSGPLQPMTFSIFEGQEPSQVIFQFKANPPAVNFKLTGETDGILQIQQDGLLYHNKALDRETRAVHKLQVSALDASGAIVEGPVPITIEVKDINDNRPTFLQLKYEGSVRQNSRPGKPFMYVNATDLDDPTTPNGQLFYEIIIQLPKINNVMYFQINNKTGAISLTQQGSQELDPVKNALYSLVVSVKDMGGQSDHSFSDSTSVNIVVKENIWKAPEPVEIVENSTDPHPIKITQVQWNEPGAHYLLVEKEKMPSFPFSIDQEGNIYVTRPLDREEKDSYVFHALAKDETGTPLARSLQIRVKVKDINDNPPTCPSAVTVFEVQENENMGSNIGTFIAHDMDEENTPNSVLRYRIADQIPKISMGELFLMDSYLGVVQLAGQSLKKQDTPQYNLTIEVSDKDFKTLCHVEINVIDINDQIPIFEKSDYGNLTLAEDTAVGSTILTIQATDADEPFTGSSKILYHITQGDNEGQLGIDTDPQTNVGYVIIKKPLDFETVAIYNIVFQAENPEPLVPGVNYNTSSSATFKLIVKDVNEAPQFSQRVYQAIVVEDVAIGTRVGNVTAKDPENLDISYSLRGNRRGWLKIDPVTGEIFTAALLDREAESLYRVQVVATEVGGFSQSSTASFHLTLWDINDNPPRLAKEYTGLFLCHPLQQEGTLIFEVTDDDRQSLLHQHVSFSIGSESFQHDWNVLRINDTHGKLSTKGTNFEERVYNVPIRVRDGGRPPLEGLVYLPGVILAVVFIRIKKNEGKDNVQSAQASEAQPLRN
ncbi:cadherin-17 isoform X2 [Crocuta crocuta]